MSTHRHQEDNGISETPQEHRTSADRGEQTSALKDVGFSFVARFSTMVFSIVNQSILAWFLGPAERGAYAVAMIFANTLGVFFILGIDQGAQFYIASGRMGRAEGTRTALSLGLGLAAAAVITGIVLLQSGAEFFTKAPSSAFLISLGYIPLMILTTCIVTILMGLCDFKGMAVLTVVGAVANLLSVLLLIVVLRLGLDGALYCSILTGLVQLLWGFRLLRKDGALGAGAIKWSSIGALTWYGLRFYVGSITLAMNVQVGTVVIAFFATKEEIGIFSLAVDFITRVMLVPDIVSQVVQPRVAMDPRGKPELVAQTSRLVFLISSGILLCILLSSWLIVPILFSPEFESMIPLLWIIGPGVAIRCAAKAVTPYLNGTNRPEIFSFASFAGILVNVGVIYFLFPSGRLFAAALALTSSFMISSLMIIYFFWKFSGLGLRATWLPRRSDALEMLTVVQQFREKFTAQYLSPALRKLPKENQP